jgi:hypothetical protein
MARFLFRIWPMLFALALSFSAMAQSIYEPYRFTTVARRGRRGYRLPHKCCAVLLSVGSGIEAPLQSVSNVGEILRYA